ncbi:hypothetical protein WJX73_006241 [Symbiochloris irregularis]|uniref:DAGKc domain-containing protein n=1 Tax=Symbiochloris irregularis TaxID=706552 RepID=A0AAW1PFV5_9CHLO
MIAQPGLRVPQLSPFRSRAPVDRRHRYRRHVLQSRQVESARFLRWRVRRLQPEVQKVQPEASTREQPSVQAGVKKALFIVVHGKKAGDGDLRAAIAQLRKDGHEVSVRVTYEEADMERFVREAVDSKVDVLVAAGGDGSINQAAAALVELKAPEDLSLAIIPMGTANDFATGLGIPTDPWEALEVAVHRSPEPVDVGTVNGRVFINVATGGFGTELTVKTDEELKKNLGGAAYAITGLTSFGSVEAKEARLQGDVQDTVRINERSYQVVGKADEPHKDADGRVLQPEAAGTHVDISGELLILAVGNGRQAGGGVQLCSKAALNDGLLDVAYIMNPPPERIPELLGALGNQEELERIGDFFGSLRVPSLEVQCKDGLQVNVDGEPMHDTRFKFEIEKGRLKLHVPEPKLLEAVSDDNVKDKAKFLQGLDETEHRPEKESVPLWQRPVVKKVLQNVFVLAIGVGLGVLLPTKQPVKFKA